MIFIKTNKYSNISSSKLGFLDFKHNYPKEEFTPPWLCLNDTSSSLSVPIK